MDSLAKWLQGNPTAVVLMFFFTVLSGLTAVIGFIVGWKKLYHNHLAKRVSLPRWAVILAAVGACVLMLIRVSPEGETQVDLAPVHDKIFGIQRVTVDGKLFIHCKFLGSEIMFRGKEPYSMVNCEFTNCKYSLSDNAALTLSAFTAMYTVEGIRPEIEATFQNIRTGIVPKATPPVEIK